MLNKRSVTKLIVLTILFLSAIISKKSLKFLDDDVKDVEVIKANVRYNLQKGTYKVELGEIDENAAAYGTYTKSLEESGWDKLAVSSYQGKLERYTDSTKAYAMGYLEGYLTWERIWNHYTNVRTYEYAVVNNGVMPDNVKSFLNRNFEWMKKTGIEKRNTDPYWAHVYAVLRQMEGMIAGYNAANPSNQLTCADFQVMNAQGDIGELGFFEKSKIPDFKTMSVEDIVEYIDRHSHCSALIKVAPDFSDVWFGHNTWTTFSSMNRIFKEYRFKSNKGTEKSKTVAFSGYPGTLSSIDDFYITDADLYVTETTNQIFKEELYQKLTPESLLTWLRTMIANRLSDNGKTWTEVFAKYNSGTYNNQFQILDLKLIDTDKKVISDGALWIIEQIPGETASEDVTETLRYGYWPSYNSAYIKSIRTNSGYDEILAKKPELKDNIDYDSCARANIFRRDQNKVVDIDSYKKIIRYNQFKTDPLSKGNPALALACRKDLSADKPECRGATDAKFASIKDIKGKSKKVITIIAGPTTDDQEPFDTSKAVCAKQNKYVFKGLPEKFNFSWTTYETTLFDN